MKNMKRPSTEVKTLNRFSGTMLYAFQPIDKTVSATSSSINTSTRLPTNPCMVDNMLDCCQCWAHSTAKYISSAMRSVIWYPVLFGICISLIFTFQRLYSFGSVGTFCNISLYLGVGIALRGNLWRIVECC